MATIDIPYGKTCQRLILDDARLAGVLRPSGEALSDVSPETIIREALERPIGSPPLSELARGKRRVLVITSDHTRPVPSRLTLPPMLAAIRQGSPDADIVILIATGMHRPTTEAELRRKLGDGIVDREAIVVHDARRDEDMSLIGTLPSGGALRVNRLVPWAELVVSDGFIEPHFFAGFSGGRKSILPGVASRETVLYNHNAGFIAHPLAAQGSLNGNPLHRDMAYAARTAGLRFILNVLLGDGHRVIAAFAGDPEEAHAAGCALSLRLTRVMPVEAEIAVTSNGGYPLDQNLYQAVKGMTAAEACVKPGGAIVMCAALDDGHGGEDFFNWFALRANPAEVARDIAQVPPEETRMDQWEAQILARVLGKATCFFVTGEENRALVERMHMRWAPDVNAAVAAATALLGDSARVTVIPDGVGVVVRA
ncbi:MAG: nickel-dependent lactate racemase [Clostridiales bacterium]|nr:nickel-dependent lactate racemase [Clostridiales bacterium]